MLRYCGPISSFLKRVNFKCASARLLETDALESLKSTEGSLIQEPENSFLSTSSPIIVPCRTQHPNRYIAPRQAWLTSLNAVEEEKLGLVELHPSVFAVMPRLDVIRQNMDWQRAIHFVDYKSDKSRADMPGGGRKPWRQKGTGRARHGSIRSPIFLKGGKAHAKWGPKTNFYMMPLAKRVLGLISTLSCKFAQDDLVIVESLDIPTDKPKFIEDVIEKRKWGISVLFINHTDVMPRNISLATDNKESITLMPFYGLNVYSMLKYDTLVFTWEALNKIEERLLFNLNRADIHQRFDRMKFNQSVLINSS